MLLFRVPRGFGYSSLNGDYLVNVSGSVVFVTGANRGLGLAFAKAALAQGA